MTHLEAPGTDNSPEWDTLYRARGDEVIPERPIFTGDVYINVRPIGLDELTDVLIVQHPCVIRSGTTLAPRMLVAEVTISSVLKPSKWSVGHFRDMPLPYLRPNGDAEHFTAHLDRHHLVKSDELRPELRVACLSQIGVNLLMQRWVHHNSRVIVPSHDFQRATSAQYEEADLMEDFCLDRADDGVAVDKATSEIDAWLGADGPDGQSPRDRLFDEQQRSAVRREVRAHLSDLRRAP